MSPSRRLVSGRIGWWGPSCRASTRAAADSPGSASQPAAAGRLADQELDAGTARRAGPGWRPRGGARAGRGLRWMPTRPCIRSSGPEGHGADQDRDEDGPVALPAPMRPLFVEGLVRRRHQGLSTQLSTMPMPAAAIPRDGNRSRSGTSGPSDRDAAATGAEATMATGGTCCRRLPTVLRQRTSGSTAPPAAPLREPVPDTGMCHNSPECLLRTDNPCRSCGR